MRADRKRGSEEFAFLPERTQFDRQVLRVTVEGPAAPVDATAANETTWRAPQDTKHACKINRCYKSPEMPRASPHLAQKSDAARCDIAVNVITPTEEDDAVTGRVRLIIFQLVVRYDKLCSDVDVFAA